MTTLLIAQNETRESGSFCGDQLCSLKAAYLFAEYAPPGTDRFIMSVSPGNEMTFLWTKFVEKYNVQLVHDNWNPGDWTSRWNQWERWRTERRITLDSGEVVPFDHYRELYLRIHGHHRQMVLCGHERGLGRRNIYMYWWCGQEGNPEELPTSVDWFDDTLIHHPPHAPTRDVYISPHAKTQGNYTFTFEFWTEAVHRLIDAGISVTVGYDGQFCQDLSGNPLFKRHWGDHKQWMAQVCCHKLVACGNTGTGWLAAACGVPMITMEPPNSMMPDHRYRECGLRNIVEVVDTPDAVYVARRIVEEIDKCIVMTTGCYDILHAGHVRHLAESRAMGTRLIVAMNSDASVKKLKGESRPINPQDQRKAVLESLRSVDEVRITDDPMDLVREVRPNILTAGYGYTVDKIVGKEFVESYGGRVAVTCRDRDKLPSSGELSTTGTVRRMRAADVIEVCRAAELHSCNPLEKLQLMAMELLSVKNLSGDMVDLGTYRGGSALVMRRLFPGKALHLFDTWEGTPINDPLCHHKKGEWAASIDECKRLVGCEHNTYYYEGVFPKTTEQVEDGEEFCFVYVDMDTYQATKDAIDFFWPRLVQGGKIFIDDYRWEPCSGVQKAVEEVFSPDAIKTLGYACVVEK